jgi:hypothetical protein
MTLSTTTTAILTAAIAAAAALAKKFLPRPKPKPEYISRAEFHDGLDKVRDRIGASYLALADKIELQHNQVLTTLAHQGDTFERRLDQLESNLARLDERTKSTSIPSQIP